jgi:ABC-type sugar transport system substrate-binding protein
MRFMGRRGILGVLVVSVLACVPERPEGGAPRLGMMPKLVGIPYFNACRRGAEEAARELGVELVYDGPDTADSNRQVEIVNAWIARGFEAVAVAPNNPEAMSAVLRRARERGARVLSWDTDAVPAAREVFLNQVDDEAMARALLQVVAEETGGKGSVALISGTETAANQNTWMAHMRRLQPREFPGLVFVEPVEYPGEDEARSYQSAAGLLRRTDRPAALIGITSVSAPAAAKAVRDAGLAGKVVVTGVSLPSAMRSYVESGAVKKFVLWNPVDLGYLTVHAARHLLDGKTFGERFRAGRLGELEVRSGMVLLGKPVVFDRGNIGQFDF